MLGAGPAAGWSAGGAVLVETVHGMRTVKALAIENARKLEWDERVAEAGHARLQSGRIANWAQTLVTPPSRYFEAAYDVLHLDLANDHVIAVLGKIAWWLSGPGNFYATIPLNAVAVALLAWVGFFGSRFDPWLRLIALATGCNDKAMAIAYERRRPPHLIDESWITRCRVQLDAGLAALAEAISSAPTDRLSQVEITTATMLGYVRLRAPEALVGGRYQTLHELAQRCEALPAFKACLPTPEEIGGPDAQAALLRLREPSNL